MVLASEAPIHRMHGHARRARVVSPAGVPIRPSRFLESERSDECVHEDAREDSAWSENPDGATGDQVDQKEHDPDKEQNPSNLSRSFGHISAHSDFSLSLEPMLQSMAVSPTPFFVELIGTLGNPGAPINRLDRPGLAIWTTDSLTIGFFALCERRLHGFFRERQPEEIVTRTNPD
jgi:hypothetical protein